MRNHRIHFLTLLPVLMLAFTCVLPAFAANLDLGVEIISGNDSITVKVDDSEAADAILAATPAKLEIPCGFDAAYVVHDSKIIGGSKLENGHITFPVTKGGAYTIVSGTPLQVTFNSNDGSTVVGQDVAVGSRIAEPEDPIKAGFLFAGWYSDAALHTVWNFEMDTVTENITLYAKWTDSKTGSYTVTDPGNWNPRVDESTLDAAANAQAGNSAALQLTITSLAESNVSDTHAAAIEKLALGRKLEYLDMTLECSINSGIFTDIGNENAVLLEITLDFNPTDKRNIAVFRYHDDEAAVLPGSGDGERFELDQASHKLTLFVKRFSTYAIGYTTGSNTLDAYQFSKGANSSWAKDSSRNLVFVCSGPFELLEKIAINGQEIAPKSDYAAAHENGTQITLKPDFLKNLARGKYYLELYYQNGGYAIAPFTVTRSSGIAYTRDLFNMVLWGSLLGISTAGVVLLVILRKRRK